MNLLRDIDVSQGAAWFMLHRIREAWAGYGPGQFDPAPLRWTRRT